MNKKEQEILVITQEECAEVIQEISKCFRFGIDNLHKSGEVHRSVLEQEIGDLLCMIDLLVTEGIIDKENIEKAKEFKKIKLEKYSSIFTS
jgi:hypothetical protein